MRMLKSIGGAVAWNRGVCQCEWDGTVWWWWRCVARCGAGTGGVDVAFVGWRCGCSRAVLA